MKRLSVGTQFAIAAALGGAAILGLGALTRGETDTPETTATEPEATVAEATTVEPTALPTVDPEPTAAPEPPEPTPTAEPEPTPEPTPEPEPTPVPTEEPTPEAVPDGEVEESRATVKNGQIILEGAVPDQESVDAIVAVAAEILGPDNVINNYVIDPRAGDPNLGNVRVDDTVLFATASADIAPEFEPLLGQALALLLSRPSVTMTVEGHTDSDGSDQLNQELSQQRAQAVVDWLVERGVPADRLTAVGKGETEPAATNETEEGRETNRRIQVFIFNLLADS